MTFFRKTFRDALLRDSLTSVFEIENGYVIALSIGSETSAMVEFTTFADFSYFCKMKRHQPEKRQPMKSPVKKELFRTSQSWDGAELPDYPIGKPELVAMRYVFEPGSSLHLHHHDVINFGIVEQGELTIVSADGKEKVIHQGEAVVEMVGTVHHGENRGQVPVVLNMFYLSQEGLPLSVSDE